MVKTRNVCKAEVFYQGPRFLDRTLDGRFAGRRRFGSGLAEDGELNLLVLLLHLGQGLGFRTVVWVVECDFF